MDDQQEHNASSAFASMAATGSDGRQVATGIVPCKLPGNLWKGSDPAAADAKANKLASQEEQRLS